MIRSLVVLADGEARVTVSGFLRKDFSVCLDAFKEELDTLASARDLSKRGSVCIRLPLNATNIETEYPG